MKILRLPKTPQDFWKGIYSFKEKSLKFASVPWKWWVQSDPSPPAPKLDGVGKVISTGPRNRVGGSYLAAYRAISRLVIQTKNRPSSREVIALDGNSQVMRLLVDWGRENTWYEKPPFVSGGQSAIGANMRSLGSFHIRTFASSDGYASKPIKIEIRALGLRMPIRIKASEGFEVSRDRLRFTKEAIASNLGAVSDPLDGLSRTKLNSLFYIRKSSRRWGLDFVTAPGGGLIAVPKFVKGKIEIVSLPFKISLNVALIGNPNFQHGPTGGDEAPNLADSMSSEKLDDSGAAFNSGRGYGIGVGSVDGIY